MSDSAEGVDHSKSNNSFSFGPVVTENSDAKDSEPQTTPAGADTKEKEGEAGADSSGNKDNNTNLAASVKRTTFVLPSQEDDGNEELKTTHTYTGGKSSSNGNDTTTTTTTVQLVEPQEEQDFDPEELRYFKKMFDMFDTDKSGAIGFFEMKNLTKHLGVEMSDDDLRRSMEQIDENGNGDLEFDEFVQWLSAANANGDEFAVLKSKIRAQGTRPLTNEQIEQLHDVFKHFDNDGSGSIDVDELGEVFKAMGQTLEKEELQNLMDQVDDDGSGEMEFDEFLLLMCSNFGSSSAFDQELLEGFHNYDPTKSGMIRCEDLRNLVAKLVGDNMTDAEIDEVVEVAHTRGDGYVEYMRWESLWDACRGITDTG